MMDTGTGSLPCDQLVSAFLTSCDFSEVVSVCYKEKFLWREIRARLTVVSGRLYNAVRNPGDVVRWKVL